MPWKYTSLYDTQYLPVMDDSVVEKLNSFFRYRFLHTTHNLLDSDKNLIIEHNDGDIISYEITNLFPYHIINETTYFWKHFTSSIQCEEIDLCREKINRMTDETDELCTEIVNVEYDSNVNFNSIGIFDKTYNLSDYTDSQRLIELNNFTKNYYDNFRGIISVYPNSNRIKFKMLINYPTVDMYYASDTSSPADKYEKDLIVKSYTNKEHRESYIPLLVKEGIITEEQSEYMNSIFTENSKFDLEFLIDEEGELEDVFVYNYRVYQFKTL
jgi:hypothetical protein